MEPKKPDWHHWIGFVLAIGAGYLLFSLLR
jgi:hypothetical protein